MIERLIVGPLHTNTYIVTVAKKQCIVIDPGAEAERVLERLEVLNVAPRAIVLTHGHLDHLASAAQVARSFPGNEPLVLLHPADLPLVAPENPLAGREIFETFGDEAIQAFERMREDLPANYGTLDPTTRIEETDFEVLHTPGHTRGSVSLYSESRGVVFSGDTLFFKAVGRTDFEYSDPERLDSSIREFLFSLPGETRLFPGHGPHSTIERERANNPFSKDHIMV